MSWYSTGNLFRASVSINNSGGSAGTKDWALTIPEDWDHFWDNVLANGFDVVLTSENGRTKLNFERQSWTKATQTGVLRVDAHQLDTANIHHAWLYYQDAAASVDPASTVTISGALTAEVELALGSRGRPLIIARPERPGRTAPAPQISKASTETIHLWWDLGHVLQRRSTESNGFRLLEEIEYVKFEVLDSGTAVGGMVDAGKTRIVDGRYVRTLIKAGTSGTPVTARLTIGTTLDRVLDFRALLKVQDVDED